jgi:hypothetical protein
VSAAVVATNELVSRGECDANLNAGSSCDGLGDIDLARRDSFASVVVVGCGVRVLDRLTLSDDFAFP